jgi:peptide/nickel transport system ATP-binding protein
MTEITQHTESAETAILNVKGLKKYFPVYRGLLQRQTGWVKAVDDVSFSLQPGRILGLVGESGCGKTTTGRMVLRALDPTKGEILFRRENGQLVDMATLSRRQIKEVRSEIQMIFQDPYSSLNPRMPVLDLIAEPLKAHGWSSRNCELRVTELMERVGLDPRYIRRYPHAFSGGQRQRIGIARALALSPSLIVADEPVSALDVSVQAQILNLLQELRADLNLTLLFIAHDLSVVRYLCDEVAVMYQGRLVEQAATEELFTRPQHPYTAMLLNAAPAPDPRASWLEDDEDDVGEALELPEQEATGCAFVARCRYSNELCQQTRPLLEAATGLEGTPHLSACHHKNELELKGL